MAQTKATAKSRSSSGKGKSQRSTRSKNGSRAQSRSGSKSSSSKQARSRNGSSGGTRRQQPRARQSNVAAMANKAKGPAIAGGAALMGLAGGIALKNGGKRNGRRLSKNLSINFPKGKTSTVKVLGGAAKEIAKGGYKIGQLTSEVQKVRKAVEGQDD
jgi:hypothetical protein